MVLLRAETGTDEEIKTKERVCEGGREVRRKEGASIGLFLQAPIQ